MKNKIDFSANPNNIDVGNWVININKVGFIKEIGQVTGSCKTGSMLQFWVRWCGSTTSLNAIARDLKSIEPLDHDYVGDKLKNGRVNQLHYLQEEDRVLAEVTVASETYFWSLEELSLNLNKMTVSETVDLDSLTINRKLQQRVQLNSDVVNDYAEAYKSGKQLPPITVWHCTDDNLTYLVDGFHRVEAAKNCGLNHLPFEQKEGTFRDAIIFTLGVNAHHGLRRSNADKRKAVNTLLNDPEWSQWSNRAIAKKCGVSSTFVDKLRKNLVEFTANICSEIANNDNGNLSANICSEITNNDNGNLSANICSEITDDDNGNLSANICSEITDDDNGNLSANICSEITDDDNGNLSANICSEITDDDNNPIRKYINKDGTEAFMNTANIGKKASENHVHSETLTFIEDNICDKNADENLTFIEDDNCDKNGHNEYSENEYNSETGYKSTTNKPKKPRKRKRIEFGPRFVNPLKRGERVLVKCDKYYGGLEGVVTGVPSCDTVLVAFSDDDNEHIHFKLSDLDLPEHLSKPKFVEPSKPKRIYLEEGPNYKAGEGLTWYVRVDEIVYKALKVLQKKLGAVTVDTAIARLLEEERILIPDPTNLVPFFVNEKWEKCQ